MGGLNRNLAIVGGSDACIATHPSDMAVAMPALDATVETVGSDGQKRQYPIAEFHTLPRSTLPVENVLMPGELIAAMTPSPAAGGYKAYHMVSDSAYYACSQRLL